MIRHRALTIHFVICVCAALLAFPVVFAVSAAGAAESIDELSEKGKKEGGKLNLYAALSARSMEMILPYSRPGVGPARADGLRHSCLK